MVSSDKNLQKTITLTLPRDGRPETLQVFLNGNNVTSRFIAKGCDEGACEEATLSSGDGIHDGNNVFFAIERGSNERLISSRVHFMSNAQRLMTQSSSPVRAMATSGNASMPTASRFLPPTIAFSTLTPGGWLSGYNWIQIGTQQTYPNANYTCSGTYTAVVLDRKTLQEKTAAPESSPNCIADTASLKTYLGTLTSSDLVIVGTNFYHNADDQLDTSAVGGTDYASSFIDALDPPNGYMLVGAGGAAPGSAYENYYTNSVSETIPFATGMLIEDASGNYNFQSSSAIEYSVSPNDPNYPGQSTVTLYNTNFSSTYPKTVYTSVSGTNGYWVFSLQRATLGSYESCSPTENAQKQVTEYAGCGHFYPTGSSDPATQTQAYQDLGNYLSQSHKDQLIFLTTVGTATYSSNQSPFDAAQLSNAYVNFGPALENLGGTPGTTLSLYQSGSSYTMVTCGDCGNSLTGNVALSTSLNAQQGQTGYLHGLLRRNLNGYYWPQQTNQETPEQLASNGGADFTLAVAASQQPVEWPELSGTLLPGASSVAGQEAAFYYLSYQLVTQHYIRGAEGDNLDDIHYYFTGANNTYIDYHTFDPVNVAFPGASETCYAWTDPVTNTTLECFTAQDLQAVAQQVSNEIIYLDNVLQFMVNGSTNMKDIVASGNGSAAMALINAAAIVKGSTLQPPASAPVTLQTSGVLSLASSVINLGLAAATDGLISEQDVELLDQLSKVGTTISSIFDVASAATGGLTTGGGSSPLPSSDYTFLTTIGSLADGSLQQALTAGFDAELDSLLGDWNKLSTIGPLVTNSNNTAFYAPNQIAQNAYVSLLGKASQRSFLMSLLPSYYSVHYYPSWYRFPTFNPPNPPNMGTAAGGDSDACNSWYDWNSGGTPPNVSLYHPAYAGEPDPWSGPTDQPIDYYILAGAVQNPGKSNQFFPFIDAQLGSTLFTASGLNIPMDAFVGRFGPMASVFLDTTTNGFDNFPAKHVTGCAEERASEVAPGEGTPAKDPYLTTTKLTTPATAVLGEHVVFQVQVTSPAGVPSGKVSFQDGKAELGTAILDGNGRAAFTADSLSMGMHSIQAFYVVNDPYYASQSASNGLRVYANAPEIDLSLSTSELSVALAGQPATVTLQATSRFGFSGNVELSCSGLPAGVTCSFNPALVSIDVDTSASSALVITGSPVSASAMAGAGTRFSLLLVPMVLLLAGRLRNGRRQLTNLFLLLLSFAVFTTFLSGCGGDSNTPKVSGRHTILLNATAGSVTRTLPLTLDIQ